jgi:hypothetical protein
MVQLPAVDTPQFDWAPQRFYVIVRPRLIRACHSK